MFFYKKKNLNATFNHVLDNVECLRHYVLKNFKIFYFFKIILMC
jgi:hypothetical protein